MDYLANLLTPNITIYEQRQISKFKLKTPGLSYLTSAQHKSFSIHALKIWNDLLHHIRSIDSTVIFKVKAQNIPFSPINTLKSTSENFHKEVDRSA